MKPDLEQLKITEQELEELTGFDINEIFIGGLLGGVYRSSVFHNYKRLLFFGVIEVIATVLVFVFTLPLGLAVTRNSTNGINQLPAILQFLQITIGITFIVIIAWNFYMWFKGKRLKKLMHLLDEVDKYNQVLQAVNVIDRLEAVGNAQVNLINRNEVLQALRVTRDSLTSGLMTEKILRESRILLARRYDLITNIENNLMTLRTLEINNQANEYGQLLNEALQISLSVHKEVQKISISDE